MPYSHITLSQNVNIFVKTKNAQEALKHKINLNFFVTWAFPYGGVGGGLTMWEKFPRNVVFDSEDLPKTGSQSLHPNKKNSETKQ